MHSDKKQHSTHSKNPHSLQDEQERRIKALEEELSRTKKQLHSLSKQYQTNQVLAVKKTNDKSNFVTSKVNSDPHNVTQTTLVSKQAILDSLVNNTDEGILAVEHQDEERLRKMIHKSKLLFSMLKLDQFSQQLTDQAPRIKDGLDESVFRETIIHFKSIIRQTSQRIAELG